MNVGQKIDHYTLEDKVGEGGFGDVFRAIDDNTGMEVAIKCSRPNEYDKIKDFEQRFMREVSCISKLRHPGIVQLFDYGSLPNRTLYLVMEYVCGLNLEVLIKRDAPYSYVFASNIVLQILDALSEAHAQGIVHRDLKPANIMLVQQGLRRDIVKLLDFGIAKAFDGTEPDLTRQTFDKGVGFGSPQYMPPEQFYGAKVGPYSDLYAVGLLFLELLTGKQAMAGKTLSEVVEKQLRKFPEIPPPFNQGPLFDVFRRALAKQPSMRYQTALEMYCDIDAIVRQQSPFLQVYAAAAGKQAPQVTVSLQKAAVSNPSIQAQTSFDIDEQDSTVDTMLFEAQRQNPGYGEGVDISNFNTMIFDSDINPSASPAPKSLYDEIEELAEMAPTDDMSRIAPTVPTATNQMQNPLPPSLPIRQNGRNEILNSEEMDIATHSMQAHPELAFHPRVGPSAVSTRDIDNDIGEMKTVMVEPEALPPITEDFSPVFHQQRTQFISKRLMDSRRPTEYRDGFFARLALRLACSKLGMALGNSAFAKFLVRTQKRLSRFIDSLYEEHFIPLVIGVCVVLAILFVVLAWLVFV